MYYFSSQVSRSHFQIRPLHKSLNNLNMCLKWLTSIGIKFNLPYEWYCIRLNFIIRFRHYILPCSNTLTKDRIIRIEILKLLDLEI